MTSLDKDLLDNQRHQNHFQQVSVRDVSIQSYSGTFVGVFQIVSLVIRSLGLFCHHPKRSKMFLKGIH